VLALEQILPELHQRGYEFVTVSDLMKRYGKTKKVGKDD